MKAADLVLLPLSLSEYPLTDVLVLARYDGEVRLGKLHAAA